MFILCPFFLNGILVFASVSGNRALSGRVTSSETIRSCSFESGARISCRFLNRLKFLSVGAISHRFVQIPYRSISSEAVLQSPISTRYFASNGATSWSLNSFGFRFSSKKCTVKSFKNSSCVPTANISATVQKLFQCLVPFVRFSQQQHLLSVFHCCASRKNGQSVPYHIPVHSETVSQPLVIRIFKQSRMFRR